MVYDLLFAHGICKSRDYDCVMLVLPPKLKQIHQSKSKDQNSSTNLDETSCKILGVASNWMRVIKCLALQTRMKKNKYLWLINLHLPLPSWRVSYCLLQNSGRDKHEREIIPIVLQLHWTQQIVDYFISFLACM